MTTTNDSNPSHPFNKDRAARLLRVRLLRQLRWYLVAAVIFLVRICAPDVRDARAALVGLVVAYFAAIVAIHTLVFWLSWRKRLRPFRGSSARVENRGLVIRRPDGSILFVAPPDRVFGATRKEGRVVSVSVVAEGGVLLQLDAFDDLDGLWREIGRMFESRDEIEAAEPPAEPAPPAEGAEVRAPLESLVEKARRFAKENGMRFDEEPFHNCRGYGFWFRLPRRGRGHAGCTFLKDRAFFYSEAFTFFGRMFERRDLEFVSFDQLSESKLFRHVLAERDRLRDLVLRKHKRRWCRAFLDKRIRHDSVPCTLRTGPAEPPPAEKRHSSEP